MTMVATFCTCDYALMVSDLRRTNMNHSSEFYDDCTKICKINDGLLIGYSGNHVLAQKILSVLKVQFPTDIRIESVAATLKRQLDILSSYESMKDELDLTFHIVGLNENGDINQTRLSQFEGFKYEILKPLEEEKPIWSLSYAEYNPTEWIEKQINDQQKVTISILRRIAEDMIKCVSEKDPFVSPQCEIMVLKK